MKHNNIVSEQSGDWHPAQIVCALRMRGWSVRGLSRHHGYNPCVLNAAIARQWPKGQMIIAKTLGVKPQSIWPSRYNDDGSSKKAKPGPKKKA